MVWRALSLLLITNVKGVFHLEGMLKKMYSLTAEDENECLEYWRQLN